jgi:hypothetical protein
MTNSLPQFVLLEPTVLDLNRVTLHLKTTGFPPVSNVSLNFTLPPSEPVVDPQSPPDPAKILEQSPYPNVELNLLDENNQSVAQATIIEHKEKDFSFTLHLRNPQSGKKYTAQADMIHRQQIIHTVSTSFILENSEASAER